MVWWMGLQARYLQKLLKVAPHIKNARLDLATALTQMDDFDRHNEAVHAAQKLLDDYRLDPLVWLINADARVHRGNEFEDDALRASDLATKYLQIHPDSNRLLQ